MSAAGQPGERQAALDAAAVPFPTPMPSHSTSCRPASAQPAGAPASSSEWVAGSLFVIPALYMAAALALAEILPRIEGSRDVLSLNFENDTARTFSR
jgi:hypothetical protein